MVVGTLFLLSLVLLLMAFQVSPTKEETIVNTTYTLKGEFTHTAFGRNPLSQDEDAFSARYFASLVEAIDVGYSYRFAPAGSPLQDVEEVEVSALIESPGSWQKEVVVVPRRQYEDEFSISFPLDLDALQKTAAAVGKELGTASSVPRITLKANVHVRAETPTGTREADFVQTTALSVGASTLTWQRGLTRSETGEWDGVSYEHQGEFDYAIRLKDNLLFGPVTLRPGEASEEPADVEVPEPLGQVITSEPAPERPPEALPVDGSYSRDDLERIDVTFGFPFEAEPEASSVSQTVEISGVLAGRGWTEPLALLPETTFSEDLSATFALDAPLLFAMIEASDREHQVTADTNELSITATVHTFAETAFGPIEKKLQYPLTIAFRGSAVSFPEIEPRELASTIQETITKENPSASAARTGASGLAGLVAVALAFVGYGYIEARRQKMTELELEAYLAKRKYREMLVDVDTLPEVKDGVLVRLASIEELAKGAEALLKPILHVAAPDRHVYFVIDGNTMYRYLHRQEPEDSEAISPPDSSGDDGRAEADGSDGRLKPEEQSIWYRLLRRSPRTPERVPPDTEAEATVSSELPRRDGNA